MGLTQLLAQLDPRPDVRGRQFEELCRWYLQNAPEYRSRFRHVWLWREWSDGRGRDTGIDLVAEEHDGGLWAIQAKQYDPAYSIKKADVDSFLAASGTYDFSFCLLIASTDLLGATARKTLDEHRHPPAGYRLRFDLEHPEIAWPASLADLRPRQAPRKRPLPHVREAITSTVKGFETSDRGQLIMACGTGKTLAALWIAERVGSTRTLVLVPSLSLLAQTLREWCANASERFEYLPVCSDQTVAEREDDWVQHTSELGLPAATDPGTIAAFLRRRGRRVVFATYQSSPQIAAAYGTGAPAFDLAIADEAHRCAGRVASEFATILDGERIRACRRLFMTATPRYYTPRVRREAGLRDWEIASMDDEAKLRRSPSRRPGKIMLDLPAAYVGPWFADAFNTRLVERTTESWEFWYGLLMAYVLREGTSRVPAHYIEPNGYKLGQWVGFQRSSHNRGELSDARTKQLEDLPEWTWHTHRDAWVDGYERMRRFVARERHADVPKGFMDQDGSRLDLWALHQRADYRSGKLTTERARRLEQLHGWKWEPDEAAFNHGLDRLGRYVERHSNASVPNDYVDEDGFKLGDWVQNRRKGYKRGHLAASHIAALEAVPGWGWSLKDDAWEKGYERLQRFAVQHGHARIPSQYQDVDGYRLGSWVSNQRYKYSIGRLAADRIARLEQVDGWTWGTSRRRRSTFDSGLAELAAYVDVNGDARVPAGYKTSTGFDLGAWCMRHRTLRKGGRLSVERVEALDALGFVWDQLQHDFERGATELAAYIAAHGDANVPQQHTTSTGFNLGTWCSERRKQRKAGRLSAERVAALDALGFVWDRKQQDFERGLGELAAYVAATGDARVPARYVTPTGFDLGGWCSERRKQRKAGRLSAGRVAALDALGFVWGPLQEAFDRGLTELAAYVAANGDARVPSGCTTPSGFKLGTWCAGCREKHKGGQLPSERVAALDALGFIWDQLQHDFERGVVELAAYVAANGDARVPTNHIAPSGFKLGGWSSERRKQHKAGRLSAERVAALEAVPGWTWDARGQTVPAGPPHNRDPAARQ